jgi:uncharacterized membrane protein YgdD (TMEM256/DUF423 family)
MFISNTSTQMLRWFGVFLFVIGILQITYDPLITAGLAWTLGASMFAGSFTLPRAYRIRAAREKIRLGYITPLKFRFFYGSVPTAAWIAVALLYFLDNRNGWLSCVIIWAGLCVQLIICATFVYGADGEHVNEWPSEPVPDPAPEN